MTLLFMDGFDHYAVGNFLHKWTSGNIDSMVTGRLGVGQAANINQPGSTGASKSFTGMTGDTMIVGCAFKMGGTGTAAGGLLSLMSSGTRHITLGVDPVNGQFIAHLGTITAAQVTGGASATGLISRNNWYYVEMKAKIADSPNGTLEVRLNGATIISTSGVDTRNASTAYADTIGIGDPAGATGPSLQYDDLYVIDATTGSAPTNTFLGDSRVETLMPSGNGNSSQLLGSDGNSTDNYLLVDETIVDPSDYVGSGTVSDKDTYAFANLATTSGTVYGVQLVPMAWKSDAGTRQFASVARLSGTEVDSASRNLSTSVLFWPDLREAKPGGGVWTISDVNAAEFGAKVTL